MKNLVFIICFQLVILFGCTKDNPGYYGQITGPDYSLCYCCGGWYIDIEEETYRFFQLPENSSIELNNEIMPLDVILEWVKDENGCLGDEIFITNIMKR